MAALNPVRAVRKKITKISAERMWSGARVARKKKKNWACKRRKNRGTAPRFPRPAPTSAHLKGGRVRAGCRGSVVRFGGVAHPLAHPLPALPEVFFLALPALPSTPTKPPVQRSKSGRFQACFWCWVGRWGDVPGHAQQPPSRAPESGLSALPALPVFPTDPPHHPPTGADGGGIVGEDGLVV